MAGITIRLEAPDTFRDYRQKTALVPYRFPNCRAGRTHRKQRWRKEIG